MHVANSKLLLEPSNCREMSAFSHRKLVIKCKQKCFKKTTIKHMAEIATSKKMVLSSKFEAFTNLLITEDKWKRMMKTK